MQPDYKGPEVALVERIMQLQTLGVRCLECGNACLVPPQFMHCAKMLKVEDLLLSCVCVCVCVCFDLQADVFEASPSDDYPFFWGNLYGGQLMGQVRLYDHP
jgi:hypothetical protein